ncbi:hypothetical protein CER19_05050 [Pseudomonas sp. GL93]|uniref:FecR domain-containing protein n=1 Tax=Pseudomonas sp. GL93 TaxID=2014741 RepID=UPI000E30EC70|nr:FecR domain-containing protein [Pseudomonas sp. GL93]RFD32529.1 hypothetical protein CER19_05050 [Pseudomonas sp. GL93]
MGSNVVFSMSLCAGLSVVFLSGLTLADPPSNVHIVKKGDTLWNIAGRHLQDQSSWTQIQKLNSLSAPENLQVGTELNIPLKGNAFPVRVVYLQGQGWLSSPGQEERPLVQGMTLDVGHSVRIDKDSFVTLGFGDGVKSVLPSLSRFTLGKDATHGAPQILLQNGEVESYVPKRATPFNSFEVITPQGVLGVRGTHFRVRTDTPQRSVVEVLHGKVVVSSTGVKNHPETPVNANQGVALNAGAVANVRELLGATQSAEQITGAPDNATWQIRAQPVPAAAQYLAQLSRSADFLAIEQDQLSPHPQFSFKGLSDAFYYVRIVAIDSQGLRGAPAEFLLLHRTANGGVEVRQEGQSTLFNWTAAPHESSRQYRLIISSNADLSSPFIDQRGIQSTSINLHDLPPGALHWRVSTDEDALPLVIGTGTLH